MWKYIFLAPALTFFAQLSSAQLKEQIRFNKNTDWYERIHLSLSVKTGSCHVESTRHPEALQVSSPKGVKFYDKTLRDEVVDNNYYIQLALEQDKGMGVRQNVSNRFFGEKTPLLSSFWTIYLTEEKPYLLDVVYGIGDMSLDLSDLSIDRFKIRTGSADVKTFYESGLQNKVPMDTFSVQVDMGHIDAQQLNLAQSSIVIADVGFGSILLDFKGTPSRGTHVKGSVGTGSLVVLLPGEQTPVKVTVNNSFLCDLSMHKSLKEISKNTFANAAYLNEEPNPLTFEVDVSMGTVAFK